VRSKAGRNSLPVIYRTEPKQNRICSSGMRRKIRVCTRLSERSRELIPETRWGMAKRPISYS